MSKTANITAERFLSMPKKEQTLLMEQLSKDANFESFKKGRVELLMESALDSRIRRLLRKYVSRHALITESGGERIIRMDEWRLQRMVQHILRRIREGRCPDRIGEFDIVRGNNKPHAIKSLKKYGKTLYDRFMFHSPEDTYCVYTVGKDTHRVVYCRLEYDKEWGTWLGFTPLEPYDVPTMIRQWVKDEISPN